MTARNRFITIFIASYALGALAWIFLSDQLLSAFTDIQAIVWLSTAKGIFFVVVSTAMFFVGLRSVPGRDARAGETVINALTSGITTHTTRWPMYAFAIIVTASMLLLRNTVVPAQNDRMMLTLFMLPIVIGAMLGGLGPGLVATAIAGIGTLYLFIPPTHSFRIERSDDLLQWCFLLITGVSVSVLSAMLRVASARAEAKRLLLDAIISSTPDAVFIKDLQGRYLLINRAGAQFVGKPIDDLLGRDDTQLFDADTARKLSDIDRDVVVSGRMQSHEERVLTQDGKTLDFWVTKGPVKDGQGHAIGLFGISRDVTERKAAAAKLLQREQQLARVIAGSNQGYWDWNLQTNRFEVSARWEQMLGYVPGEVDVSPEHWGDLVHPEDLVIVQESIRAHCAGETPLHEVEFRARTKAGGWCWLLTRGRIVERTADGKPLMMSGTHTDITERKQFEMVQKEASTVFASSYEGIMVVSPQMRITKVNPAFTRITGYSAQDIVGQSPAVLSSGRQDAGFYRAMWESLAQHSFWSGELWNRRKNGELYAELLSISAVRDAGGGVLHFVGVFSDISQLKSHEAELDRIAHYDPLTGTPNRRLLADRLDQAVVRATRSDNTLAVCFLDLDGFKDVNDRLGHAAGDALLVGVTQNLHHVLRADDTLARMGGDEFVLLLSDIASPEECSLVLDRVLQATSAPIQIDGQSVSVTASIGVSLFPNDNSEADALLRHADQAMYQAKEAGKNQYHLFDPEADRQVQVHRKLLETLRHALRDGQFVLFYQPKVNLRTGDLVGVEALLRWQHPQRGLLAPAEFLRCLDGTDLERPLGEWVIHTALEQAATWQRLGLDVQVSVNISAAHLLDGSFHDFLREALAQHPQVPPDRMELEVLETAAIADMDQAVTILRSCHALGVHFALDDFGTGYSSLTYLRKLPVDILKIDQSFVRNMLVDPDDLGIVEGVIRLAAAFKRAVIAEGVETLEHGATLLHMGCDLAQGYGIARPMPPEQLPQWWAQWKVDAAWVALAPAR